MLLNTGKPYSVMDKLHVLSIGVTLFVMFYSEHGVDVKRKYKSYVTLKWIWHEIYHKLLGVTYLSGFVDPITLEPPPTMFQSSRSQRPINQQAVV